MKVRISEFGWVFFPASNGCWIAFGVTVGAWGLVTQQLFFTVTVDFSDPVGASNVVKDSAFVDALAQVCCLEYLSVGEMGAYSAFMSSSRGWVEPAKLRPIALQKL